MLTKRIIPCLDVKDGRVVKGVSFVELRDAGDPVESAKAYEAQGADELVFLDITASHEKRKTILDVVEKTASDVFMPLTVGGGIRTLDDIKELFYLMTRSELLDRLAVLLGGRVAEELVFGENSTGAQNDLQRASGIARSMVTEYGMSDLLGLVTYEHAHQPMFLPENFTSGKTYSETKATQIDEEISRVIEKAHERVRKILLERRAVLDDLAHLLSQKEIVQGQELREMLAASKPGTASPSPVQPS